MTACHQPKGSKTVSLPTLHELCSLSWCSVVMELLVEHCQGCPWCHLPLLRCLFRFPLPSRGKPQPPAATQGWVPWDWTLRWQGCCWGLILLPRHSEVWLGTGTLAAASFLPRRKEIQAQLRRTGVLFSLVSTHTVLMCE